MGSQARVGYVRVSTLDQRTDRQLDGLQLDRIFEDKVSGKNMRDRPQLEEMLKYVREGDVVYVHSMDRLARNLEDLLGLVRRLTEKGVTLIFLKEKLSFDPLQTASPMKGARCGGRLGSSRLAARGRSTVRLTVSLR